MNLLRLAATDYVLLSAAWTPLKGIQLIRALDPGRVIIRRSSQDGRSGQDSDYFYLFSAAEILSLLEDELAQHDGERPKQDIETVLNLQGSKPVAALEGSTKAGNSPYRAVVLENGRPVGYIDASVLVDTTKNRRDASNGDGQAPQRSLLADMPDEVQLHSAVSLLVSISKATITGDAIALRQEVGSTIDIVLSIKRGFKSEGKNEGSLLISGDDETSPLEFSLKATDIGPADIRVYAFHDGVPVGWMKLQPTVVPPSSTDAPLGQNQREMSLSGTATQSPDLVLLIEESMVGGQLTYTFRLTARDPDLDLTAAKFGPFSPRVDFGLYFERFYRDIDGLPLLTDDDRRFAAQRLASKGAYLYDKLVPPEVQALLRTLRRRGQSITISILSEEAWVPWELCRLPPDEQVARGDSGAFLCEAFALSRWIPGPTSPRPNLPFKQIALVVPSNSGLPFAEEERDFLQSLAGPDREVTLIPPKFIPLTEALGSRKYDTWHFTGHGMSQSTDPDSATIKLEDQPFTPVDLSTVLAAIRERRPFVFLNACQVGRGGLSLTGIGGWAQEFIAGGARAFVAPLWSVYDEEASIFAEKTYRFLLSGKPLAESIRLARLAIKSDANPTTWLAYTVYGDPFAMLQ